MEDLRFIVGEVHADALTDSPVTRGIVQVFKFDFLFVNDKYFHNGNHDLLSG